MGPSLIRGLTEQETYSENDVANIIGQILQVISIYNNRDILIRNFMPSTFRFDQNDPLNKLKFTNMQTSIE